MWYKKIFFVMLLVYFNSTNAQLISNKFRVNFKVDEYILDDDDKCILDDILTQVKAEKYCELTLSAHTDNDADDSYNMNLSKRRAQSVYNYLLKNGVDEKTMDINWYGERKPEAQNLAEEGKAHNRRVEIEVRKYNLNSISDLLQVTGGDYTQNFNLEKTTENIITGKDGTKVNIPQDAFETASGKSVPNDKVAIELQEFQKPMDAIFNNLSTICDGKILESGGMLNIKAVYNGEELKVRTGKSLAIEMPSKNIKPGMELFTGVANKDNTIEWQKTKQPFAAKLKNPKKLLPIKVDETYWGSLYQDISDLHKISYKYTYTFPIFPTKPYLPRTPRKFSEATEDEYFSAAEKIAFSKHKKARLLAQENKTREERYNKRMEVYERRMKYYEKTNNKFLHDSIAFAIARDSFYTWISNEIDKNELAIELNEKFMFNKSIRSIIALNKKGTLNISQLENSLYYRRGTSQIEEIAKLEQNIKLLNWLYLSTFRAENIQQLCDNNKINYISEPIYYFYKRRNRDNSSYSQIYNKFACNFIHNDSQMSQIFKRSEADLKRAIEGQNVYNAADVLNAYVASTPQMGYLNCDRFTAVPEDSMFTIKVKADFNADVYYYVKEMNSMIHCYKDVEGNFYSKVPKGAQIHILVIEANIGVPKFKDIKHCATKSTLLIAETEATTIRKLQNQLAAL